MITQKHEDEMQQRDQLSSPVEGKKTTPSSEERSKQALPSLPRWISVLLCILGVALPLVAGSIVCWPLGFPFGVEMTVDTAMLVMAVLATIGAFLLGFVFRAWWAALLIPAAWIVGDSLGSVARRLVDGWWPFGNEHFWDAQSVFIPLALVPLIMLGLIGAMLGIGFRRWWEKRQQRR